MKWIKFKDELPPEHEKVLVIFGDDVIMTGIIDSNNVMAINFSDGINEQDYDRPVTHWMPLPEPPLKNH